MAVRTQKDEPRCLFACVRIVSRALDGLYDRELAVAGVTAAQLNLMRAILHRTPATAGALGEMLRMDKSTLSRNLSRLQRRRWVRVRSDAALGRRVLELTAAGEERVAKAAVPWRRAQAAAHDMLGVEGADALRLLGRKLLGD